MVENMIDGLAPSGYMRYAPDGWSQFQYEATILRLIVIAFFSRPFRFRILCLSLSPQGMFLVLSLDNRSYI